MKKIILYKIIISIYSINLYGQTPLITDKNQIKQSVREEIVSTSNEFRNLKNNVVSSTTTLNNRINNLATQVVNATTTLKNDVDNLNTQVQSLQNLVNNATNQFLLKGGDTTNGNYTFNGEIVVINNTQDKMARIRADRLGLTGSSYYFRVDPEKLFYISTNTTHTRLYIDNNTGNIGIGNSNPQAKLDINGNIRIADGTQGAGKVLTSDENGFASWQTINTSGDNLGNHIATTTLDMNENNIINVGKIYTQDWTDLTPDTTYYSFYPSLQFKVIGDITCINGTIICINPNNCTPNITDPYAVAHIGDNYSHTPKSDFVVYKTIKYDTYSYAQPYYGSGDVIIIMYSDGNLYQSGLLYNEYVNIDFCFRNKL
jgi:hypothetical protein